MTEKERKAAAKKFVEKWKDCKGYEKGETQQFWTDLLQTVYGIKDTVGYINFEPPVKNEKTTNYIDAHIPSTKVVIEQKSKGTNLRKAKVQSDGEVLTPYQQARRYVNDLATDEQPKWVITCNFETFLIYDMNDRNREPEEVLLSDLEKDFYRLEFLANKENVHIKKEMEISKEAGLIIGELYDEILHAYDDKDDDETLKNLNILCVRLVFLLYAEDSGVFPRHQMFHDYLNKYPADELKEKLDILFKILSQKESERDKYAKPELLEFPYVNGGLFKDKIVIPRLNEKIRDILIHKASEDFDWSDISPTIFGAIFESTLNQETRRKGGMHYTAIENIHKVIDPLFFDSLQDELDGIIEEKISFNKKKKKLYDFQEKIANLKFLDPACGSGNFLTETYLSLRRLENQIFEYINNGQMELADENTNPIKVSIGQFYGIEINDFAVTVGQTALWIAENQMMKKTEDILSIDLDFLPLKSFNHIIEGNALTIDWDDITQNKVDYIMGNPPFVGARLMEENQKNEIVALFKNTKNVGNLDYVSGWYVKAAEYIKGTQIEVALVSTNSICQGEQPAILWKKLFNDGIKINYAYRTFRWDSESYIKAHVHCIIVGFAFFDRKEKIIYDGEIYNKVKNINAYLVEAENIFIDSRSKPLCDVPEIGIGNKPIDDGNYLFTEEEMKDFIRLEPKAEKYFRPFYGAQEFINNKPRYCLWIGRTSPEELMKMPKVMERIRNVKEFRLKSKSPGTVKLAETPTRFHVENIPQSTYLLIPRVSSENRRYIPIGYMDADSLCSDSVHITTKATMYEFGVLNSLVHMSWMRAVAGRLKSDYRYSKDIVYNNFPWPNPTKEQKERIEKTAELILKARDLYKESSLASLYNDDIMPKELKNAHIKNNIAVLDAYGFKHDIKESEIVAKLMKMYQNLVDDK